MPAGNKTYDAVGEPEEVYYTVNHYYETITDNNFATAEKETKRGKTGAQTNATASTRTGFTARSIVQSTITGDGKTAVNVYYDRNSYDITLIPGSGIESVSGKGTYKYGQEIEINANVKSGFTWDGWLLPSSNTKLSSSKKYKFTVPVNGINLIAYATQDVISNGSGSIPQPTPAPTPVPTPAYGDDGGGGNYYHTFSYKDKSGKTQYTSTYEKMLDWAKQNPDLITNGYIYEDGVPVAKIEIIDQSGSTAHIIPMSGTIIVDKYICSNSGCC